MTDAHALYQRWIDDLWNGDLERAAEIASDLVTPSFRGHWPGQPDLVGSPDALAEVVRQGRLPFEGLRFEIEVGPVAAGDLVAGRWVGRGQFAGPEAMPGATAAAGTAVEFRGHDLLRLDGERFAEYWVISEAGELMARLGAG